MRLALGISVRPKALRTSSLPSAIAVQIERSETPIAAAASRALYANFSFVACGAVSLVTLRLLCYSHAQARAPARMRGEGLSNSRPRLQ